MPGEMKSIEIDVSMLKNKTDFCIQIQGWNTDTFLVKLEK